MATPTIGPEAARQVGEQIQLAREERDLSISEVANLAGISARRLRQVEKGETPRGGVVRPTRLPRNKLMDIAQILGMDTVVADRILKLAGYHPLDSNREVVYLHDLPEDAQRRIRELADKFRRRG